MPISAQTLARWIEGKMAVQAPPPTITPDGAGSGSVPEDVPPDQKKPSGDELAAISPEEAEAQQAQDPQMGGDPSAIWGGQQTEVSADDAAALTGWLSENEPFIYEALVQLVGALQESDISAGPGEGDEEPAPDETEEPLEEEPEEPLDEEDPEAEALTDEEIGDEDPAGEEVEPAPEEEPAEPMDVDDALEAAAAAEQQLTDFPPWTPEEAEDAGVAIVLQLEEAGNPESFSPEWEVAFGLGLAQARSGEAAQLGGDEEVPPEEDPEAAEPPAPRAPPLPSGGGAA